MPPSSIGPGIFSPLSTRHPKFFLTFIEPTDSNGDEYALGASIAIHRCDDDDDGRSWSGSPCRFYVLMCLP